MKDIKDSLIFNNLQSQLSSVVMNSSSNICENGLTGGLSDDVLKEAVDIQKSLDNGLLNNSNLSLNSDNLIERVLDKRSEHIQHLVRGQSLLLQTKNSLNK